MDFLQYPLALLVTLGVLVTFHELGHFIIARWSGVTVVRFSVGFGKPFWSWRDRRGTEFALAYIPLGGYVRMLDEREPGVIEYERRSTDVSYNELSVWWRMAIALGGPAANFLLAIIVYWVLFVIGTTTYAPLLGSVSADSAIGRAGLRAHEELIAVDGVETPSWQAVNMALAGRLGDTGEIELSTRRPGSDTVRSGAIPISSWHTGVDEPNLLGSLGIVPALPPIVAQVVPDSPADRAGFRRWDQIVSVDGEAVADWGQWVELIRDAPGKRLRVVVDRAGRVLELDVTPDTREASGGERTGFLGVGAYTKEIRYGLIAAVPKSLGESWDKTVLTLGLLKKMITGHVSVKNLSGPITIAKVAGDSARSGWRFFFSVLALLSISLGVLNLLPIPILDGGHIMFCGAEAITGRPVSERVQILGTQIGLFMVASLMLLAIYNDISRLL
jgi:regulator of sigma E protease